MCPLHPQCTSFCAGGRRLLRRWVCRPLQDAAAIGRRQDAVAELLARPDLVVAVRARLRGLDIERSLGRAVAASQPPAAALPHDLTAAAQRRCLLLKPIPFPPGFLTLKARAPLPLWY